MHAPLYGFTHLSCGKRMLKRSLGLALLASACWSLPGAHNAHAQGFNVSEGDKGQAQEETSAARTRAFTQTSSTLKLPTPTGDVPRPMGAHPPQALPSLAPIMAPRGALPSPTADLSYPSGPSLDFDSAPSSVATPNYIAPVSQIAMPSRPLYPSRETTPAPSVAAHASSSSAPTPMVVPAVVAAGALPTLPPAPAPMAHAPTALPPFPPKPAVAAEPPLPMTAPLASTQPAQGAIAALPPPPPPLAGQTKSDIPVATEVTAAPAVLGTSSIPVEAPAPTAQLSPESKRILGSLHPIPPTAPAKATPKVDMKRVNPEVAEIVKKAEQFYESAGVSIKVSQPSMNATSELERAYNSLMGGETEVAVRIYKDILNVDPANEEALFGLAATYHRTGQTDNARPLYGRLLKQNPAHREALNNFLMLVSNEAPQEALNELANLEQRYPTFSPIPAQMSILYERLGQPEVARSKILRAIELSPENWVYKYNLAIMLDRQSEYAGAADIYKQLIAASLQGEHMPMDMKALQTRYNYISAKIR